MASDEAERLADKLDEAVFNIVTCGPTAERIAALCAATDIVAALLRTPAAPPVQLPHEGADEGEPTLEEWKAEAERLSHILACVADHASGGRISKTNYTLEVYYEQIDDYTERLCQEAIEEHEKYRDVEDRPPAAPPPAPGWRPIDFMAVKQCSECSSQLCATAHGMTGVIVVFDNREAAEAYQRAMLDANALAGDGT